VLLKLPHRQFVFTLPKLLRVYFKYDRTLFEDISRIIFSIIHDYYTETAKTAVNTGVVVSYQSFGDLMRWNPHFHCIVLEGGIDETGSFHHIPIKNTARITGVFRNRVIKLFVDRGLLDRGFASSRKARLIQKIYEVDPLKVIAVITDPGGCILPLEVQKILKCLKHNKAPPFDRVALKVS
jgi:hypothetical protein